MNRTQPDQGEAATRAYRIDLEGGDGDQLGNRLRASAKRWRPESAGLTARRRRTRESKLRERVRSYKQLLRLLWEFEGVRAVRWPAAALGMFVAVWSLPIGALVASSYLVESGHPFYLVLVAALGTVAVAMVSAEYSQRHPWRTILQRRASAYLEWTETLPHAYVRVRQADWERATLALRRTHLSTTRERVLLSPPADAPHLDWDILVFRPAPCDRAGVASVEDAAVEAFEHAGIEARVNTRSVGARSSRE
jgi:hypothetical protein